MNFNLKDLFKHSPKYSFLTAFFGKNWTKLNNLLDFLYSSLWSCSSSFFLASKNIGSLFAAISYFNSFCFTTDSLLQKKRNKIKINQTKLIPSLMQSTMPRTSIEKRSNKLNKSLLLKILCVFHYLLYLDCAGTAVPSVALILTWYSVLYTITLLIFVF